MIPKSAKQLYIEHRKLLPTQEQNILTKLFKAAKYCVEKDATPREPNLYWVRLLLEKHNITQTEAARRLGVSPRTVRNWCAGKTITYSSAEALRNVVNKWN